jgi:hypothetical protein
MASTNVSAAEIGGTASGMRPWALFGTGSAG